MGIARIFTRSLSAVVCMAAAASAQIISQASLQPLPDGWLTLNIGVAETVTLPDFAVGGDVLCARASRLILAHWL